MAYTLIGLEELLRKQFPELMEIADELKIEHHSRTRKSDLIAAIYAHMEEMSALDQARTLPPSAWEGSTIDVEALSAAVEGVYKTSDGEQHSYTKDEIEKLFPSRRLQVFFLLSRGYSRADVARLLGIYYSQVHSYAKQFDAGGQPVISHNRGYSHTIRQLADAGWDRASIAKKLDKPYSFVHNVLKRHQQDKEE